MPTHPSDTAGASFPSPDQQPYQDLKLALEDLQATLAGEQPNIGHLKMAIADLQQQFQQQILTLDLTALDPALGHQVQSLNVEIDKQLRLLNMDTMFLQVARQAVTIEQRQGQIRDRLTTLIRYCSVVLTNP